MEKQIQDAPPLVRIEGKDGEVYYPAFEKSTDGKWTSKDKQLQTMNRRRHFSGKPPDKGKA